MDYQCSYDGQPPYSCASPFTIDNSLVLIPTNIPIVPSNNTHTLLISAVDSSGNVEPNPCIFYLDRGTCRTIINCYRTLNTYSTFSGSPDRTNSLISGSRTTTIAALPTINRKSSSILSRVFLC